MSRLVDTADLAIQLDRYGNGAFLLTAGPAGGPHAVSVRVAWDGTALVTRAGRTSRANLADRPDVTLLWPLTDDAGYSLIVDGQAEVVPGSEDQLRIAPTAAVLHRSPARHAEDPPGSECVAVLRSAGD
ncbi:MAG TPA: hypothetical protein VMU63_06265 [Acidimicrobiales bacterium]|nr:hypothetical protein [Acidimicrobiales bacterium]